MFKGEHRIKTTLARAKTIGRETIQRTTSWLNQNKFNLIKTVGTTASAMLIFGAIVWWGNHYVDEHTKEVFHVYVKGEEAGTISDPEVVEKFILDKVKELEEQYPNAHMLLDAEGITYEPERAFMIDSDDELVLDKLDDMLTAVAVGVEIRVDGELIGIVKDQETADMILAQVQEQYIPLDDRKKNDQVSILSVSSDQSKHRGQSQLEEVGFVEQVEIEMVETKPEQIAAAEDIVEKLRVGDTKPTEYVVVAGDCVNCIAQRFDVSPQIIYDNNNLTEDSILNIGDVLDLTVEKPILSVKTVERQVEMKEVPFDTIIEYDDKARVGVDKVIASGIPGQKLVTFLTTKINGYWAGEEIIDEEILIEPTPQVLRKGTMVVKGEGTGTFSHPLRGKIRRTSGYGMRWGRLHAGVDYVSSNKNIYASDNGVVETAGSHTSYGNYVIIDHKNGYKTLYAHLSKISTKKGHTVEKGDVIGVMGNTGRSTGTHLHFEIRKNGKTVNPANYIK